MLVALLLAADYDALRPAEYRIVMRPDDAAEVEYEFTYAPADGEAGEVTVGGGWFGMIGATRALGEQWEIPANAGEIADVVRPTERGWEVAALIWYDTRHEYGEPWVWLPATLAPGETEADITVPWQQEPMHWTMRVGEMEQVACPAGVFAARRVEMSLETGHGTNEGIVWIVPGEGIVRVRWSLRYSDIDAEYEAELIRFTDGADPEG